MISAIRALFRPLLRSRAERATVRLDPVSPSAVFLRDCFAEVMSSLDAHPRRLEVDVFAENESALPVSVDYAAGNPVFRVGCEEVRADFRRRWSAAHPVPLVLNGKKALRLSFEPISGNRVSVSVQMRLSGKLAEKFAIISGHFTTTKEKRNDLLD